MGPGGAELAWRDGSAVDPQADVQYPLACNGPSVMDRILQHMQPA